MHGLMYYAKWLLYERACVLYLQLESLYYEEKKKHKKNLKALAGTDRMNIQPIAAT